MPEVVARPDGMTPPPPGRSGWPLGVSQWILGEDDLSRALARVADAGFDTVELSCRAQPGPGSFDAGRSDLGSFDVDRFDVVRALADAGLRASSVCPLYGPDHDLASPDPTVRAAATGLLRRSLELAGEVGAGVVIVVPSDRPSPVEPEPRVDLLARVAEGIAAVVAASGPAGPAVVIEPLNRYETHLVRTVAEAAQLCDLIASDRVGVMADLFHMNIEEDDGAEALRRHAGVLRHVHLADNQRREPGSGRLDVAGALGMLDRTGYDGVLVLEFLPATDAALRRTRQHLGQLLADLPSVRSS